MDTSRSSRRPRVQRFFRTALCAALLAYGTLSPAGLLGVSPSIVISQVYGGGGNSGATVRNDFVEIFNRGTEAVDVTGWSVQYAAAAGTTWQGTNLSGTLQPGHYYLIQEAQGAGGSTNLPTPDAVGTIAMSATGGKVALVNTTTLLGGTGCPPPASVVDFVGYDGANCFETAAAPALTNTAAALRAGGGCTDTDNNSADFAIGIPTPRNSAAASNSCAAELAITNASPLPNATVGQPYSVTFTATSGTGTGYTFAQTGGTLPPGLMLTGATLSGVAETSTGSPFSFTIQVTDSGSNVAQKQFQLAVNPAPTCAPTHTIAQIQGSGDTSPLARTTVTTSGIVTGAKSNGFFIQMPAPGDGDTTTSDGVFVFTSSAPPPVAITGNDVCVTGNVQEFIPTSDPASPPQTEIASASNIFAISTANALPPPVVLGAADTDPAGGIDQLEKYEGMRVRVESLTVTAPTEGNVNEANATATSNGVFYGVISGISRPFREPGIETPDPLPAGSPCCVPIFDANPERLRVSTLGQTGSVALDVTTGATVTNLVGPLDYAFRSYTILPDPATPPVSSGGLAGAIPVRTAAAGEFTVASANIERFFDTTNDPESDAVLTPTAFSNRLNKVSLQIRQVMRTPDVIGLEEVEHLTTLQAIASKVNGDAVAAGDPAPNYQAYLAEGNDIGGIDVGLLVKTTRVNVIEVTQQGKDTVYTDPSSGMPATLNDRPPLILRATINQGGGGAPFPITVIVNHLRSLSGVDDPADGGRVRAKRRAQAEFLANLIQTRQATDPEEHIVSIGDYNAFQFNDGYVDVVGTIKGVPTPSDQVVLASADLVNTDLIDLVDEAPASERYSFVFDGNAQELDHVLVSQNLQKLQRGLQYGRTNADFPESFRNDASRPERISDHDPLVAYFMLPVSTATTVAADSDPSVFGQTVTFTATVTATPPGAGTPTGTVQFSDGGTLLGAFSLNGTGQAVFITSSLGVGTHAIAASYAGDGTFTGSTSTALMQTVNRAATATAVASSPNPSVFGQPVTFTATVSVAPPGAGTPAGTVRFSDGATPLGSVTLDASGHASFVTSDLSAGTHVIAAEYDGSSSFNPSSGSVDQSVQPGLTISDVTIKEGNGWTASAMFRVTLSPPSTNAVTVRYATADGTASAGSDYVARSGTLVFPAGVTTQSIVVLVIGDLRNEPDETFFVSMADATNASIARARAVGTIVNDDPVPSISIDNAFVREGNGGTSNAMFTVSLTHTSGFPVTVKYATADGTARAGSDYQAASGVLTFNPGERSKLITIVVDGDRRRESNETFFVNLSDAANATIADGQGRGTIHNDDRRGR
jgi:predicted extracellular nuclease